MVLKNYTLGQIFHMLILPSLAVTVKMVLISGLLASILGTLLGVALVVTAKDGLSPHPVINRVLDIIVNVIRSFPFIILLISIIPFTRLIAGTSIGWEAAIVPLTVACTPFMGRVIQNALQEVDPALIEAARSFGASKTQIVFRVMLVEAVPAIISGLCLGLINLIGCTAMAGTVGAGGLGATALTYGYQNFNDRIMYTICLVLVILVAIVQYTGDYLYRRLK
ncbi:methionine ABC transporter permease [Eubacterium pyruvativorans]|uniref:methionine ABC transporter permease n=1 Tax=Eubacterium pyruvativorans TaxID=155865 RepID=UPI0015638506|nr:methionine ABC transporter permease [Eubacterium pyruvativorans]MCI5747842.1 ABC transporter permease [Eubacterium pyruvativorans]MDD6707288.1 ABC transporter permease [Eubacterium pyruvativorans]MDD7685512.1 ABC transporter permease [Eubacterium pyruvativorans]